MKISIITPSYNQAQFIERTIQSVLSQGDVELEYIVIDGESTDGTLDILRKFEGKIRWISEKDRGQSDAINKGLRMATGDIVAFLNSDDTYCASTLHKVADFFLKNPEIKWASGKCHIINENDREIRRWITWYKNILLTRYSYALLLTENFISQPATFWRRELLQDIGYINEEEHFCMDYEYWLRIGKKYPLGVIDIYLANFRYYMTSKSGGNTKRQFQDQFRLAKKFGNKYPVAVFVNKLNYYKTVAIYWPLRIYS